jgi:hypothetical protein
MKRWDLVAVMGDLGERIVTTLLNNGPMSGFSFERAATRRNQQTEKSGVKLFRA